MDTADERRALKSQMRQTQLEMKHTRNCLLLPDRLALLDQLPSRARVAEIGVAFGDFTREIMARTSPEKLTLIDSWASERYEKGLAAIEAEFAGDLSSGRIGIARGLSVEKLKEFEPNSFDWVYIDTNHSYRTTLQELELCKNLVCEKTGRIAGHDFCTGNVIDAVPYGVVEAVTQFVYEQNWQFEFLTVESRGHFSFCIKRL